MEENRFDEIVVEQPKEQSTKTNTEAFYSDNMYDDRSYLKPKKCPPGHFKSIAAGGKGHTPGDDCNCGDGEIGNVPTVSIDWLIYPLMLTVILLTLWVKRVNNKKGRS